MPESQTIPLHRQLLQDEALLLATYDQAAQEFLDVGREEGHFAALPGEVTWPRSVTEAGPVAEAGLARRVELVDALWRGIPARRDGRLKEAFDRFAPLLPPYHEGARLYLRVKSAFVARGAGTAGDLHGLYQALFLEALARGDSFAPDAGEAALERAKVTRVPLSHAQAVAGTLSAVTVAEDPRSDEVYTLDVDGRPVEGTLRSLLQDVAQRTVDLIASGGLLAARFNTYTNFAFFGCAVWKVLTEAELALFRCGAVKGPEAADLLPGKAMMIEFMQAHREDPSRLKPEGYWYGQQYSYLTRDLIDLACRLAERCNAAAARAGGAGRVEVPDLLRGNPVGRFTEYAHVGRKGTFRPTHRAWKMAAWAKASWRFGRRKVAIGAAGLPERERLERAWESALAWGNATVEAFGIDVRVTVDPAFGPVAADLGLSSGRHKVLFLPTHQSLFDHPVMFHALQRPEMLAALGWSRSRPCAIVALTGLSRRVSVRLGRWSLTMFGVSSERFDELQETVDGYVMIDRASSPQGSAAAHTTSALARALSDRPGIIYPMGTTAAFAIQNFPMQHAVFAHVPPDVVIVPMALRGIHQLWPKCPSGNVDINPGVVEVYVAPPMLGETTLLPRRRSLRVQAEAAALFQAVHITTLLDPNGAAAEEQGAGGQRRAGE